MKAVKIATWSTLRDRQPAAAEVAGHPLVVIRYDDAVSVFTGLCPHRGGRMSEGRIEGDNLVCGAHGWSFRVDDGVSPAAPSDSLRRFQATLDLDADAVFVDEQEIGKWAAQHVMPFDPEDLDY